MQRLLADVVPHAKSPAVAPWTQATAILREGVVEAVQASKDAWIHGGASPEGRFAQVTEWIHGGKRALSCLTCRYYSMWLWL